MAYEVRQLHRMGDCYIAEVRALWMRTMDTAIWWCEYHQTSECEDVTAVEEHRENLGLIRPPVLRAPDDR